MSSLTVGNKTGEIKGKTKSGRQRVVIRNVVKSEVPRVEASAKALPNYSSHRTIKRTDNSNYDIFIYLE